MLLVHTATESTAYIGCFNWLSDLAYNTGDSRKFCTLAVRHSGFVAEACRSAAAFLIGTGHSLATSPYRWRTVAGELERVNENDILESSEVKGCRVSLVRNQDHSGLVEEFARGDGRLMILTSGLKSGEYQRLHEIGKNRNKVGTDVQLRTAQLPGDVLPSGGLVVHNDFEMRANLLASDKSVVIGNYLFLSTESLALYRPGEASVRVEGGIVPSLIWTRFAGGS
jgi:hypothetical protein